MEPCKRIAFQEVNSYNVHINIGYRTADRLTTQRLYHLEKTEDRAFK